jgi:hypothetical protein
MQGWRTCHGFDMIAPDDLSIRRFVADYPLALKKALHGG